MEAGKKLIAFSHQEKGMGITRMIQLSRLKRMKRKKASAVYEKDCEGENEVDGTKLPNKGKCAENGRIPEGWERRKVTRVVLQALGAASSHSLEAFQDLFLVLLRRSG